jgi:hypothetical protein
MPARRARPAQRRHEQLELPLPADLQALLSRSEELDAWLARQAEAAPAPPLPVEVH